MLDIFIGVIFILLITAAISAVIINSKLWFVKPKFSGKQAARHLVVISIDAMAETEWQQISTLPNMSSLIKKGASTKSLNSVYPTLTYVVHTTMVTGKYPDGHKIIHNHQLQPGVLDPDQEWYWYQAEVKAPTLYDLANKSNMITAGILWPVTAKSSIDYNFPELQAVRGESQTIKILKNGTLPYLLSLELRLGKQRRGTCQPYLDDFATICAEDTIKSKKPNLMLIHLTDLDTMKHEHRVGSAEALEALERQDRRLGDIIKASKDAGTYDDTVFVVLSDHGQLNVDYNVYLNNLLEGAGLITSKDGKIEWRAYSQTTGGSAYLHLKEGDTEAEAKALEVLEAAAKDGQYGIEEIYDRTKLDVFHADKSVRYAIEAKKGYTFQDELTTKTVEPLKDLGKTYATHGFSPDKPNYKCIFIAAGPGIKSDYSIGDMEMVDVAPTLSRMLGMDFYQCDGRVMEGIFK